MATQKEYIDRIKELEKEIKNKEALVRYWQSFVADNKRPGTKKRSNG